MPSRSLATRTVSIAIAAAGFAAASGLAQVPTFSGLGDLSGGTVFSRATGVSADGLTVVGSSGSTRGNEAFRWTDPVRGGAGIQPLGDLNGGVFRSAAFSVSEDGRAIVGSSESVLGTEAFRWTDPTRGGIGMEGLGDLPGGDFTSAAFAMSLSGSLIVGVAAAPAGDKAFRWTDPLIDDAGGITPLMEPGSVIEVSAAAGISPDGNIVVGRSGVQAASFASIWINVLNGSLPPVQLGDLPGGQEWSTATASSDPTSQGYVVVGHSSSALGQEAIEWTDPLASGHGLRSLGDLPGGGVYSAALDISRNARLIVGFGATDDGLRACVWGVERTPTDLKAMLLSMGTVGLAGWTLGEAAAVSPDGQTIIGNGVNPVGQNEAWIVRMPGFVDPTCPGDRNGDRAIDADDLFIFLEGWFSALVGAPTPASDIDGDNVVTADDIFAYISGWLADRGTCD